MEIKPIPPFEQPFDVAVADGEIVLLGPEGFRASFTPAAARESAKRILLALEQV